MIDQCSRKTLWLKCSNSNKAETEHDLFLKAVREKVTRLQVRGDVGIKNRLLAKCTMLSHNSVHNICAGGKSTHNTRVDLFWLK